MGEAAYGRGASKEVSWTCLKPIMSRKVTIEEFIQRAKEVHKNFYLYNNVKYVKMLEKVCITCTRHGDFWQTPADHLSKHGCPKCKADKQSFSWQDMYQQFPDESKNYYTYDETTYKRNSIKMKIICPKHGEFWQKPELHKNGSGCKKCTASGGPGKYCETLFNKTPALRDMPAVLYFIQLFDTDGTKFYKIGITTSMRKRFYSYIEKNNGKICWTKQNSLYQCFLDEQKLLKENKEFLYCPTSLPFGGRTECITKEITDDFSAC